MDLSVRPAQKEHRAEGPVSLEPFLLAVAALQTLQESSTAHIRVLVDFVFCF